MYTDILKKEKGYDFEKLCGIIITCILRCFILDHSFYITYESCEMDAHLKTSVPCCKHAAIRRPLHPC